MRKITKKTKTKQNKKLWHYAELLIKEIIYDTVYILFMQEDMFDKIDGIVGYFVTVMKDVYFFFRYIRRDCSMQFKELEPGVPGEKGGADKMFLIMNIIISSLSNKKVWEKILKL